MVSQVLGVLILCSGAASFAQEPVIDLGDDIEAKTVIVTKDGVPVVNTPFEPRATKPVGLGPVSFPNGGDARPVSPAADAPSMHVWHRQVETGSKSGADNPTDKRKMTPLTPAPGNLASEAIRQGSCVSIQVQGQIDQLKVTADHAVDLTVAVNNEKAGENLVNRSNVPSTEAGCTCKAAGSAF